jgi:hypothetical protein
MGERSAIPQDASDRAVAVVACPESLGLHDTFLEQFLIRPARLRRLVPTHPLPEHVSRVQSVRVSLRSMAHFKLSKPSADFLHRFCPGVCVASSSAATRAAMSSISIALVVWFRMLSAALSLVQAGACASTNLPQSRDSRAGHPTFSKARRYQRLSAVIRPPGPAPRALLANRSRLDLNRGARLLLTVRRNEYDLDHVWGTCWDHTRFESFQPSGQSAANHPSAS